MRHDNILHFLAKIIGRVQNDVQTEPRLMPLPSEISPHMVGNSADEARSDIRARGFWRHGQNAYFDVRVTNPLCATAMKNSVAKTLDYHEREKKRKYNARIMTQEHGTFTPLIFTALGTTGKECDKFLKTLSEKIAIKDNERYEHVINWIRCKISFLCIKSCILCVRGSRSLINNSTNAHYVSTDFSIDLYNANL